MENYEILTECFLKNKETKKKKWCTIPSSDERDMIETRRCARQNHPKNSVVYVLPDEPVKPIGQTVEKNYEFF